MYCDNCATQLRAGARFCPSCGSPAEIATATPSSQPGTAIVPVAQQWVPHPGAVAPVQVVHRNVPNKTAAGICGILLNGFGIHKFILGYTTEGLIMLIGSVLGLALSCFIIPAFVTLTFTVIGFIEGIIYLTKSDEDFIRTYVDAKKGWF